MPTVHILVEGRVQGVSFRANTKRFAESVGITGWVKNTSAGHVEIIACGSNENIQTFIEWCKDGPTHAVVTQTTVTVIEEQHFKGFLIEV